MHRRIRLSFVFLILILISNIWLPWDQAVEYMYKQDVAPYMKITEAAPNFPKEEIAFHLAQRFFVPYLMGVCAKLLGVNSHAVYYFFSLSLALSILVVFVTILHNLAISSRKSLLCVALLIFNPYMFRYYALVPGMSQGLLFNFGLGVILWGLISVRTFVLFLGICLAGLGRQTEILVLPWVALWVILVPNWIKLRSLKQRLMIAFSVFIIGIGIYKITGWIARPFSLPSTSYLAVLGSYIWIKSGQFTFFSFFEYILRIVLPFVLGTSLIGVFILKDYFPRMQHEALPFGLSLLMAASIVAQPLLSGPDVAGQSATRLSAHGMIPFLVGLAYFLRAYSIPTWIETLSSQWFIGLLILIFIGSFHHLYSVIGPQTAFQYVLGQFLISSFLIFSSYTTGFFAKKKNGVSLL